MGDQIKSRDHPERQATTTNSKLSFNSIIHRLTRTNATKKKKKMGFGNNNNQEHDEQTYTLYLIRHGEASHNVLEKKAKHQAKQEGVEEGLATSVIEERMEEARKAVLDDPRLFDASLSGLGKEDAVKCREHLQELQHQFPPPTEVYVSPLQRTLQTANLVFPDCDNIHVREELQERQTGHACDTRHRSRELLNRKSFTRFSLKRLQQSSFVHRTMVGGLHDIVIQEGGSSGEEEEGLSTHSMPTFSSVEGKPMLRKRTEELFDLLAETDHRAVAVVTHKAYLRELERGPFGIDGSPEFGNGEVRIYEVTISRSEGELIHVQRLPTE